MRRFDLAIAEFSALLKKNETDSRIRYLLANAYEEKGEKKLAVAEYQRIPASFELYANAQIHAAMLFKNDGKITDAIAVIKEAVRKKKIRPCFIFICLLFMKKTKKWPLRKIF